MDGWKPGSDENIEPVVVAHEFDGRIAAHDIGLRPRPVGRKGGVFGIDFLGDVLCEEGARRRMLALAGTGIAVLDGGNRGMELAVFATADMGLFAAVKAIRRADAGKRLGAALAGDLGRNCNVRPRR